MGDATDCGDSGCVLRGVGRDPGGQRTNGGCQHLRGDQHELRRALIAAGQEIRRLRAENERLTREHDHG